MKLCPKVSHPAIIPTICHSIWAIILEIFETGMIFLNHPTDSKHPCPWRTHTNSFWLVGLWNNCGLLVIVLHTFLPKVVGLCLIVSPRVSKVFGIRTQLAPPSRTPSQPVELHDKTKFFHAWIQFT